MLTIEIILTCVLWLDASGDIGWQDPSEYDPRTPIVSCGQLVGDEGDYVILAMDLDVEGEAVNQIGSIPKISIVYRIDTSVEMPPEDTR